MIQNDINEAVGFVYITTNLVNNKKYVGQHSKFNDKYVGSGTVLKKAIKKYGKKNFNRKIVYIAKTQKELNLAEKLFILSRNAVKNNMYYNISEGGYDGNPLAGKTDEELKEMYNRIALKIRGTKQRKRPEMMGKNNPYTKENALRGEKHYLFGKGDLVSGGNNNKARKVVVKYDNGKTDEFSCAKDAGEKLNCSNIIRYAEGKLGTPKHYYKKKKCFIFYKN